MQPACCRHDVYEYGTSLPHTNVHAALVTHRFDAFETVMAILRARLVHPGVKPEDLAKVDTELAAFMRCEPSESLLLAFPLPVHSELHGVQ